MKSLGFRKDLPEPNIPVFGIDAESGAGRGVWDAAGNGPSTHHRLDRQILLMAGWLRLWLLGGRYPIAIHDLQHKLG